MSDFIEYLQEILLQIEVTIEIANENDLEYLPDVELSAARKFVEHLKLNADIFSETLDQKILEQ